MENTKYLLEMSNITKEFPGVKALDGANLKVCHLLIAQLTDHKGVDQSQRKGDEVLQNDRQGQRPQPLVKAGIPAGKGRHDKSLRCMLIWNRH